MTTPKYYPEADHKVQNFGSGNSTMPSINKVLLHTTETSGWPGYGGAGGHPTLTYNPWSHQWRQHLPIRGSATALENAGSFQTNRDHVVQIEIVAYSDLSVAKKYGHAVTDIDTKGLQDLADFLVWMKEHYNLKVRTGVDWKDYPASYGTNNGVRLSVSEFENYHGVLGHQHAPGNVHGDPGALAVHKIIDLATPTVKPAAEESYKLWTLQKAEAYDGKGTRRPEHDLNAGTQHTGTIAHNPFGDGRYFVIGKVPHRLLYPLDNGDWSHTKGGKPIS